jgi:hypothetical protein
VLVLLYFRFKQLLQTSRISEAINPNPKAVASKEFEKINVTIKPTKDKATKRGFQKYSQYSRLSLRV